MAFRSLARPLHPIGSRTFFNLSVLDSLSRKEYSERQLLNFSQKQIYDVVANVEDYKNFVPFCNHSHVRGSQKSVNKVVFEGELGVGFNMFQEKYTSIVACEPYSFVQAVAKDADLFKELVTSWRFTPNLSGDLMSTHESIHHPSCYVDFNITFEFASPIHAQASSVFFDKVSKMMLQAFIDRCRYVYRTPQ